MASARLASGERAAAGAYDHAPVRGGKPVPAGRQSFEFAFVGRHSPILGPQRPRRNEAHRSISCGGMSSLSLRAELDIAHKAYGLHRAR